jgi:hypothetical protein
MALYHCMQAAIADVHVEIGRHPVPCRTNSCPNMHAQSTTSCRHQASHSCFCRTPTLGIHPRHPQGSLYVTASPFHTWSVPNHALAGHSSDFRDKLLLHTPGLLDALLAKAISTQQDSDDVSSTWDLFSGIIHSIQPLHFFIMSVQWNTYTQIVH